MKRLNLLYIYVYIILHNYVYYIHNCNNNYYCNFNYLKLLLLEHRIIFRASKNNLSILSCDIAGKSYFILGTELWGSRYEELLRLVACIYIQNLFKVFIIIIR